MPCCARGLLPSGALGREVLAAEMERLRPWHEAFSDWSGGAAPGSVLAETEIDGVRLHGRIGDVYPNGVGRVRFGELNGPTVIRDGLDWLLMRAAGLPQDMVQFHEVQAEGGRRYGPFVRERITASQAREALRALLHLRAEGLREPLPFAPYSGWEIHQGIDAYPRSVPRARGRWHGGGGGYAECEDPALRQVLRGCDPFAEPALLHRFVEASHTIYSAVTDGRVSPGVEPYKLDGLSSRHDAEDAA